MTNVQILGRKELEKAVRKPPADQESAGSTAGRAFISGHRGCLGHGSRREATVGL